MIDIISAVIQGGFGIVAAVIGFGLGLFLGGGVWWWKARSIREMLADEVQINLTAFNKWNNRDPWPVRSVYTWEALQPVVPGLLSRKHVKALAEFYYKQAEIYRDRNMNLSLTEGKANELKTAAKHTLKVLGRKSPTD